MNVSIKLLELVDQAVQQSLRDLQHQTLRNLNQILLTSNPEFELEPHVDLEFLNKVIATAIDPITDGHLED